MRNKESSLGVKIYSWTHIWGHTSTNKTSGFGHYLFNKMLILLIEGKTNMLQNIYFTNFLYERLVFMTKIKTLPFINTRKL